MPGAAHGGARGGAGGTGTGASSGGEAPARAAVVVARDLDMVASGELLSRLESLDPAAGPVDIDLRPVEFIDSAGLRCLLEADRLLVSRSGRPRVLVARSGPVLRLLRLTMLDQTLDVRVVSPPD